MRARTRKHDSPGVIGELSSASVPPQTTGFPFASPNGVQAGTDVFFTYGGEAAQRHAPPVNGATCTS